MTKVMNAVASCGLQLYRFGETVSIPFWQDGWRPDSWYDARSVLGNTSQQAFHFDGIAWSESGLSTSSEDKILKNKKAGLHTLCLLDIKVKEQSAPRLERLPKLLLLPVSSARSKT